MKAEYDFSKGERGKFYQPKAVFNLPIYLEEDVDEFMRKLANEKGKDVGEMVNEWLRGKMQLTLKKHIDDIRDKLKKREFPNEAAVSQGIVLKLLYALGWPIFDIQIVVPEYTVEKRRVDFALRPPSLNPLVFIEVKQVGSLERTERQFFEYAFHEGIPIAILTDGREWHFFNPSGQGNYRERKVHELDLIERDTEESAKYLSRYLNYESIKTRNSIRAIEDDYKQRKIEKSLPEAWNKLVEKEGAFGTKVIAEEVENLCGYRPSNEQVLVFLKSLERIESREKVVHIPQTETAKSKYEGKGYFREDGSAEWNARGKRRVVSATIVAEMQRAYQESVVGEKGEVKYPMAILVKHGVVESTNYDKDGNWNAVAKIVGHPRKTASDLGEVSSSSTSKPSSTFFNPRSNIQSRAPAKLIVVTMPNGELIKEYSGIGTFVKVIEKLIGKYGEEAVLRAAEGHSIISTSSFNYPGKRDKRLGRLYISTNHSTELKKTYLDHIANRLRDDLEVEIVDK